MLVAHRKNPSFDTSVEYTRTFEQLGLDDRLCTSLESFMIKHPTNVQVIFCTVNVINVKSTEIVSNFLRYCRH